MNYLLEVNTRAIEDTASTAFGSLRSIMSIVLPIALGVVLLIGTIYAIVLGVNYSRAEDADKRKEAKGRLVGAIVGFLVTLVLIAVIYAALMIFLPKEGEKKSKPFEDYELKQTIVVTSTTTVTPAATKYTLKIGDKTFSDISLTNGKWTLSNKEDITISGYKIESSKINTLEMAVSAGKASITFKFTEGSVIWEYTITDIAISATASSVVDVDYISELLAA